MIERGSGRILITSSVAAKATSPNLTVYSATKAFLHTFAEGLHGELKETGVTVTALLPDATETNFFHRAGMDETNIGSSKKADPAEVATAGYKAMMAGDDQVVAPTKSKITTAIASVLPDSFVSDKAKAQ
jgi:short-subunit dehydrogenase